MPNKLLKTTPASALFILGALVICLIGALAGNAKAMQKAEAAAQNGIGAATRQEIYTQVSTFYNRYIRPNATLRQRSNLVHTYGTVNLQHSAALYPASDYQIIVCTPEMPIKVSVSHDILAPVGSIQVYEQYAHDAPNVVVVTVGYEGGFKIDTIGCAIDDD